MEGHSYVGVSPVYQISCTLYSMFTSRAPTGIARLQSCSIRKPARLLFAYSVQLGRTHDSQVLGPSQLYTSSDTLPVYPLNCPHFPPDALRSYNIRNTSKL
jgi:hypothetical protein